MYILDRQWFPFYYDFQHFLCPIFFASNRLNSVASIQIHRFNCLNLEILNHSLSILPTHCLFFIDEEEKKREGETRESETFLSVFFEKIILPGGYTSEIWNKLLPQTFNDPRQSQRDLRSDDWRHDVQYHQQQQLCIAQQWCNQKV